jgi:EpsI family protein
VALLWLALGIVAYRDLLAFGPPSSLALEAEAFFFRASSPSPVAVLALALWLLYRRLGRLRGLPGREGPAWLAGGLLLAGGLVFVWSTATSAADLLIPALVLNGLGLAALHWGPRAVRVLAVPAAFTLFAVPIPAPLLNEVLFALQIATADCTGWLLHALGVAAFVTGDQIIQSDQTFAVIENCSGLRSMQTLTMIAVLLFDLFRRRGLHALLIVIAAPPVGFALNGLRAVTLVLNPHSEIAAIHNLQGVAILLGGLLVLYTLDGLLSRVLGAEPGVGRQGPRVAPSERALSWPRGLVVTVVLAAAAAVSLWAPRWELPSRLGSGLTQLIAPELDGWRSKPLAVDDQFLGRVGFGERLSRRYRKHGESVDLFVGVGDRNERRRSPFSPKTALPGSGWIVEERESVRLEPGGLEVDARLVRSRASRRLVFHWCAGTDGLARETLRSLLALDASPLRHPGEGIAVRISTEVAGPGPAERREAEQRLRQFYRPVSEGVLSLEGWLAGKRFS